MSAIAEVVPNLSNEPGEDAASSSEQSVIASMGYSAKRTLAYFHPELVPGFEYAKIQHSQISEADGYLETESNIDVLSESAEEELVTNPISYKQLAISGLKKTFGKIKSISDLARTSKDRIADSYSLAGVKLMNPEGLKNNKILHYTLGAVALAGASYAAYRGYGFIHNTPEHAHHYASAAPVTAPKNSHAASEILPSVKPVHATEPANNIVNHAKNVLAKPRFQVGHLRYQGDSIWMNVHDKLQAKLGHNPSAATVNKITQKIINWNHLSQWKIHHMAQGTGFKMPFIK
jgi:hypothetical protein